MGYGIYSNFVRILQERALSHPDQVIFTFLADGETESGSLTYQQLDRQARANAAYLQENKGKGERALLLYQPGLEFISAFLGCLYAGVIAIPAYPPRPNRSFARLEAIIKDAAAVFALTTESLKEKIEQKLTKNNNLTCLATDKLDPSLANNWQESKDINENSLAFLQYTSGSTGIPKGVMVSHGNLIHNSHVISKCFQNSSKSIGGSWLPPYHDMGLIGGILQPIYAGISTIILPPVSFLQRPIRWLKAITNYKITTSGSPNFAYEMCVNSINEKEKANLDLSSWELAFSGAEPVRAETIAKFADYFADCGFRKEAFYPCYGMAETTLIVSGANKHTIPVIKKVSASALTQNKIVFREEEGKDCQALVSSGKVASELQAVVVNPETLEECSENQVGEIWVKGDSVAQGYWQREDLTNAVFDAYTKDTQLGPFLRTGDLGFISEGELFVTGRLKDLIIIRGRNHYPQDLEESVGNCHSALNSDSGAAFAVEIEDKEELVIIFEVKRTFLRKLNQGRVLQKEVFKIIRQTIAENHELQVHTIVLLKTGSIPKTSSGKIARHACRQDFLEGNLKIVAQWNLSSNLANSAENDMAQKCLNNLPYLNYEEGDRLNQQSFQTTQTRETKLENEQQLVTIQDWLRENIANQLALTPQDIDIQQPFVNYGLDSVQAVRLTADLEDWLGCQLSPTLAYDYPNIETLAAYLVGQKTTTELFPEKPFLPSVNSKIAIVGMACRFPGASNGEEYWQVLSQGKDAIRKNTTRKNIHHLGGYIDDYDQFDPQFFEIATREAINVDPQQRILLEVTYEALENANLSIEKISGTSTGVFVGISSSDYAQLQIKNNWDVNVYTGTGNALSMAANRISYSFNLIGPSLSVDTACSSSLVALHLAINSIRNGECEQAIVGGVNLILSPELTETFQKAGMMAEDGKCKTFDASADGYVRGEGCGVVILKPLEEAITSGDDILAVIYGSAINQDGRSNGLTAPSGKAQQRVVKMAWQNAGVEASQISYIEAHGTGTSLGDPIELNSLGELFPDYNYDREKVHSSPCWVGSAKTNLGHLEAAAGMAGLIKTVLALQNQIIPPTLNFKQLNPYINLEQTRLQISSQSIPWPASSQQRLAGISSFGFGGTNAHVVIGDFNPSEIPSKQVCHDSLTKSEVTYERHQHLLTLAAKSETALQQLVSRSQDYLEHHPEFDFADVCFTSNLGRSHFKHRLAVVGKSREDLLAKLKLGQQKLAPHKIEISNHKIAFLFTGQGSQYSQMGYELYQTSPLFKATIDRCEQLLNNYLEKPLTEVLFKPENQSLLNQTIYTQPAIFAVEYALAQLWLSWGIFPAVVMGHSVGEYVAATIAGVFSLEDGLKLIANRAKLMQKLPLDGGMICLFTNFKNTNKLIKKYAKKLTIAAINSDNNTVVSGEIKYLESFQKELDKKNIKNKNLKVSHAFHSELMQPILAEFREIAAEINYQLPNLKIISNVTGKVNDGEIATAEYWVNHIIAPVKFASMIAYLQQENYQIFLEIGAKPTLLGIAREILENGDNLDQASQFMWLPSLRQDRQDWLNILTSVGELYNSGSNFNWTNFHQDYPQLKSVKLPNYPWQHKRYWHQDETETQPKHLDWLYSILWQKSKANWLTKSISITTFNCLIFADREGLGEKLADKLTYLGGKVYLVYQGTKYSHEGDCYWLNPSQKEDYQRLWQEITLKIDKIIYFWGLDHLEETEIIHLEQLEKSQFFGCLPIVYLIQTLASSGNNSKLWLISFNSQRVTNQEKIRPQGGCLWGLGKVIAIEHPEYWGGLIDLDVTMNNSEIELLWATINYSPSETMMAIREGQVYFPRLQRKAKALGELGLTEKIILAKETHSAKRQEDRDIKINPEGTYLITGGLGALGLKTASWLITQGAKHLVLVARSLPSHSHQTQIETWRSQGIKILIANADVSNFNQLQSAFTSVESSMPPLKGIIHAAGVLADTALARLSSEKLWMVMTPKIQGAWNLHQLSQNSSLDFFLLFSSVASLLGSPGQGNYAAANAYLDAFASYRHSLNLPALSLNWGAFDMGMAVSRENSLASAGIEIINANEGIPLLGELINYSDSQIGVINLNWQQVGKKFPYVFNSPFLQYIVREFDQQITPDISSPSLWEDLKQAALEERETLLVNYLKKAIASILHLAPEQIKVTDSLLDLGMDSLMVMEAINYLKTDLQLMLYPREFYERPNISALASYLAQEFSLIHPNEIVNYNQVESREECHSSPSAVATLMANQTTTPKKETGKISVVQPKSINHKPIAFILSSPRSGSTLLRVMLAGHPNLVSPPELHLLPFETMQERQAELEQSHLGEGLIRTLMELKDLDAEASQFLINQWIEDNLSIAQLYQILQELAGDRLLIDKSPTYGISKKILDRAEAIFSQAKYIHLVRHPYSVIESFARMRMDKLLSLNNSNPYKIGESIWHQTNQNILDFINQVDSQRVCQIHYEDLVTQPQEIMAEICQFLAIPFHESVLNPYQGERMRDGIHSQSMSVGDPNFNSRHHIDPQLAHSWRKIQLPISLNPTTCSLSKSLHYELPLDSIVNSKTLNLREEYLNVRGLNLCFCSWGQKDAPLIVLVHGILDQGLAWEKVAQPLAERGYYVVAPDLRGHGKSDHVGKGGSYSLLDFVADLDFLTSHLTDQPFTLVGHSLGSVIAAILASIRPQKVSKLVLVEPVLPLQSNTKAGLENIASHLDYLTSPPTHPVFEDLETVAKRLQKATPVLEADFALKLAQRITKPCAGGVTFTYSPLLTTRAGIGFNSISRSQYLQLLSQIQSPLMIVYGDRSNFNRPEDLAAQEEVMKQATKLTITGGHNLHLESAQQLASILV
jgi:acyl transferase domain-containing protein/acyl-CoA synthetase (AMP-forming)/AMP-acid ligase II/predicted alpha/beta-fold hydrolase